MVVPKTSEQRTEIEHTITSNILFQTMDDDARQTIVDAMSEKLFHPGDVIIKQGDMGDFYYVISEGLCDVFKNGNKVVEVHKGSGFGELALLYDAPRAATVVAQTEVRTWALDRTTFKQVVVGTTMKKRELYQEFLKGVAILSTLSDNELMNLADALVPMKVKSGEIVVRQGDKNADRFYIVEEGQLKAEIEGIEGEVCARMERGSYFGERALLKDEPRAATVTATEDGKLLAMDRAAFLRLMGPMSDILARNMEVYSKYHPTKSD